MKRVLVVLLALVMGAGVLFAADPQFKWQGWIRTGVGVVSADTGTTFMSYDYDRVGTDRIRLAFSWTSADAVVGFYSRLSLSDEVWLHATANTAGFHRIYGWASLFKGMLKVKAGLLDDYTVATADWNGFGNCDAKAGMYFNFVPMAGLNIGFFQVIPNDWKTTPVDVADFYNGDMVGLAYAIPNIGALQLGAILDSTPDATSGTAVYFGFNFTGVKGLTAILESKVAFYDGSTPMWLEQNVGYAMGALTAGARFGETYDGTNFYWGVEPIVSYKLNGNLSVGVIGNVYSNSSQTFMSPIDADVFHPLTVGVPGDIGFGVGASLTYVVGGARFVVGDYYAADTNGGNIVYLNFDVSF